MRAPNRHNDGMQLPRFWIAMQIVIVICVIAGGIIALTKLY